MDIMDSIQPIFFVAQMTRVKIHGVETKIWGRRVVCIAYLQRMFFFLLENMTAWKSRVERWKLVQKD